MSDQKTQYVKLNVGGSLFQTTLATVSSCDGMLRTMFNGDMESRTDAEGYVFIDRSAKHFHTILNYLRDGTVALPENICELEELLAEAEFYLIEGLEQICQEALDKKKHGPRHHQVVAIVSSDLELKTLIASTHDPVVRFMVNRIYLLPNYTEYKCVHNENALRNIELFDQLSLKLCKRGLFIRDLTKQTKNSCLWEFYKDGKLTGTVNACYGRINNDNADIFFPEGRIYEKIM